MKLWVGWKLPFSDLADFQTGCYLFATERPDAAYYLVLVGDLGIETWPDERWCYCVLLSFTFDSFCLWQLSRTIAW